MGYDGNSDGAVAWWFACGTCGGVGGGEKHPEAMLCRKHVAALK